MVHCDKVVLCFFLLWQTWQYITIRTFLLCHWNFVTFYAKAAKEQYGMCKNYKMFCLSGWFRWSQRGRGEKRGVRLKRRIHYLERIKHKLFHPIHIANVHLLWKYGTYIHNQNGLLQIWVNSCKNIIILHKFAQNT